MLPGVVKAVKRPLEMSLPTGRGMSFLAWFKAVKRPQEELPAGLTRHFFHKKTTPELPVVVKCRLSPL